MANSPLSKLKPIPDREALDSPACGAVIAAARKEHRVEQKNLAVELGFSQPYLSDLEHGRRKWTVELFERAKSAIERLSEK